MALNKPHKQGHITKAIEPSPRRLFKAIDRFFEATIIPQILPLSPKIWWRINIYSLRKITIEEGILDIQLVKGQRGKPEGKWCLI